MNDIYRNFSSKLIYDLYEDTSFEGYHNMVMGLAEILLKFPRILELTDYHSVLSKLSWCYYYQEYSEEFQKITSTRTLYKDAWAHTLPITEKLLDIWPQVLCRRSYQDSTMYFGKHEHLKTICILTR